MRHLSVKDIDDVEKDLLHETRKLEKWANRVTRRIGRLNTMILLLHDKKRSMGLPVKVTATQLDMFVR